MNKKELIELKKLLEANEKYLALLRVEPNIISEEEICYYLGVYENIIKLKNKMKTKEAIDLLIKNFEAVIYYCYNNGYQFDKLIINPCMCSYVKKSDLKPYEEGYDQIVTVKKNSEVLEDIIEMHIYKIIIMNNGKEILTDLDPETIPNYDVDNWFTISLKEIKEGLLSKGFELKGLEKASDLLKNNNSGLIEIEFEKQKTRSLIPTKK